MKRLILLFMASISLAASCTHKDPVDPQPVTRLSQYVTDAAKRLMLNNLLNKLLFDVQPGEFIMTMHVQIVPLEYAYVPQKTGERRDGILLFSIVGDVCYLQV